MDKLALLQKCNAKSAFQPQLNCDYYSMRAITDNKQYKHQSLSAIKNKSTFQIDGSLLSETLMNLSSIGLTPSKLELVKNF